MKCLKAISSVKTKKAIKPKKEYTFLKPFCEALFEYVIPVLATSLMHYINIIHKVWVDLINEGQQETQGLLGNKTNLMEQIYRGGNECFLKITIT